MANELKRPDPDELLTHLKEEERQRRRGKLKIFLGYVAGVGKTYAMLEAAHQRLRQGVDVVVAYIETHGREETEILLEGLELIPRHQEEYRGLVLTEMDVDAVLARRPQLALVDELAHSNIPGSRHARRYQDVEELLDAGIDVYTTLNVQHLASLNDVVAQITGTIVRETIPDQVIDENTDIEFVDLPPDELLQRLKEGKVYVPDQAARAMQSFFRKGNLTALRELGLRRAAKRVDDQMREYMRTRSIAGPWPANERLLVGISSNPLSERLVRTAYRLAEELNVEWTAVYVETPASMQLTQPQKDRIVNSMKLAEELGAKSMTLPGDRIADTILEYARQHNFTKIIIGKAVLPRWRELLHRSVVEQIITGSGPIDVYVISGAPQRGEPIKSIPWRPRPPWLRYAQSLLLVAAGTLFGGLIRHAISPTNQAMIYLLIVVAAAAFLGRGPATLASLLSVIAFDYFFVPPRLTLAVSDTQYILTFFALFIVGLVISNLTTRVRDQVINLRQRQAETSALLALSRDLAIAAGLESIMQAIKENISQTFGREVCILLPDTKFEGELKPYPLFSDFIPDEHEMAVAIWAYQHGQPAGRGTDTLSASPSRFLALKTARGVVGVLGVRATEEGGALNPEQRRLFDAFASLAALAIERAHLADSARRAQLLEATETLQTALLNSISHDLRTPLVSITGALSSLDDQQIRLDEETSRSLIQTARGEAERLNRLVGNLLDMTRIQAGAMKLHFEPCEAQDIIGSALDQLRERIAQRSIQVDIPRDLPMATLDFVLIVQVVVNLLDNALKYSPPESPIEIRAGIAWSNLEIEVADHGIGIPRDDLLRVFDKFYRVQRPGSYSGTGLGLAICKGIVEAHKGRIWAQNRTGGGTIITLALPVRQPDTMNKETKNE